MSNIENTIPMDSWLCTLAIGSEVWWNDPDHGISSGYYTIAGINTESGCVEAEDTVVFLKNAAGSESEVFVSELAPMQPDDLFLVVDGDSGSVDSYGYASTKEEAIDVGNATFADEVVDAYLAHDVVLSDGSKVASAWVALTSPLTETVTVRLTLDVTYSLNGETATEMISRLQKMCERAIGEGMLTGDTAAEVDEYSIDAAIQPEPLSEDDLADFMRQRIENGDLDLDDIPVRLARYGLMEPGAFVDEMRERIEMAKSEGSDEAED